MSTDIRPLEKDYQLKNALKTLKIGKIFSLSSLLLISVVAIAEFLTYHSLAYVVCRLLLLIPSLIFLILSYTLFKKNLKPVIFCHTINLTAAMLMMISLAIVRFKIGTFSPAYKMATITGGLVVIIFIIFIVSAGSNKYLKYIIFIPLTLLVGYFTLDKSVNWKELSFFINPIFGGIGAVIIGNLQERLSYSEFMAKKNAEFAAKNLKIEIEQRKYLEKNLQKLATSDDLTGAFNRRFAFDILGKELNFCQEQNQNLVICFVDLDNLKQVNDKYGHTKGDELIKTFAEGLQNVARKTDYLCRLGGDEFLLVLPNCSIIDAEKLIQRLQNTLEQKKEDYQISFSYGFSEYNPAGNIKGSDTIDIDTLIEIADKNMYKNKVKKSPISQVQQ